MESLSQIYCYYDTETSEKWPKVSPPILVEHVLGPSVLIKLPGKSILSCHHLFYLQSHLDTSQRSSCHYPPDPARNKVRVAGRAPHVPPKWLAPWIARSISAVRKQAVNGMTESGRKVREVQKRILGGK